MTGEGLRDTFALLLREGHGRQATLSADAERTIRRRIALRWAGGLGALAVVAILGVAALTVVGGGSDRATVVESPALTPTLGVGSATFPLTGGAEFVSASSAWRCGEKAPPPHRVDHGVALGIVANDTGFLQLPEGVPYLPPTVNATLAQTSAADMGEIATSGIDVLVVRDGIVRGVFHGKDVALGGAFARPSDANGAIPLVSDWVRCPPFGSSPAAGVAPGTYDLIAMAHVFSTPESVALYQALGYSYGATYLNPDNQEDPAAIYLPGSDDCRKIVTDWFMARGCLPDITDKAVVNKDAGTVTVLYNKKDLVAEFFTVLVSEPITVTLVSAADAGIVPGAPQGVLDVFDSVDDFTCGASAGYTSVHNDNGDDVSIGYGRLPLDQLSAGGAFDAALVTAGVPDGSRMELLPGASLVYVHVDAGSDPGTGAPNYLSTVVARAPVTVDTPLSTDRIMGSQPVTFTVGPATMCPGSHDVLTSTYIAVFVVGQWSLSAPDGTVTTIDSAADWR